MAKTKGTVSLKIVDQLKGILDFYPRGNETIIRTWPRNFGRSQTPASIPWQHVFACFHQLYKGLWIGGPPSVHRSLTGKGWTQRDYTMWLYYGSSPKPPDLLIDRRDPWPPPCPDPFNRMAIFNQPVGSYSIFNGVALYFSMHPHGHAQVWVTYEMPRYQRRYATTRRDRHEIGASIVAPDAYYSLRGADMFDSAWGTNRAFFHRQLDRRFYFFMVPFTGAYRRTISVSPWYVARVKPGPTGTEWGATIDGPWQLTTSHMDYPERPLG